MKFGTRSSNAFVGSRQVTAGYYGNLAIPDLPSSLFRTWTDITTFDFYVDPTLGSDSNIGSMESPLQTFSEALNKGDGAKIGVKRGATITGQYDGLGSRTIGAYGVGDRPIFTHNTNFTLQGVNVVLQNISVTSTASAGSSIATVSVGGASKVQGCRLGSNNNKCLTLSSANRAEVKDCVFVDDNACAQLLALFQSANCVVERNQFTRTKGTTQIGIYAHGAGSSNHTIQGNRIASTIDKSGVAQLRAISIDNDFTLDVPFLIQYNNIDGVWDRGILTRRKSIVFCNVIDMRSTTTNNVGIEVNNGIATEIIANTLLIDGSSIRAISTEADAVSRNNIVYASAGGPFYVTQNTATFDYNLYFGSSRSGAFGSSLTFANWQLGGQDANSLLADPLFIDVPGGDYSLATGSPGLGSGQSLGSRFNQRIKNWSLDRIDFNSSTNRGAFV